MAKSCYQLGKEVNQILEILNKPYGFGKSVDQQWIEKFQILWDKFECGSGRAGNYIFVSNDEIKISTKNGIYGKFEVENG